MNHSVKTLIVIMVFLVSCNEPETVVTDIVMTDGSIERKIEMKSSNLNFNISNVQVPYDSTWNIKDSIEIDQMGDTLRVRRALKLFSDSNELNNYYKSDSSLNREAVRRVEFSRKFRWFDTRYRFAEIVEQQINYGYPVASFLTDEEMKWFYMPQNEKSSYLTGPDSLKYRALDDSVSSHQETWMLRSLISEWLHTFNELTHGQGVTGDISQIEDTFFSLIRENMRDFDSLWSQGIILEKLIGEKSAREFKKEADSSMQVIEDLTGKKFSKYTVRIIMPGKEINNNGYHDSKGFPVWEVRSEFFLTEPYVMYAESKVNNIWAWIITATFIIILAGAALFPVKKQNSFV